jgi:hypothetical protein
MNLARCFELMVLKGNSFSRDIFLSLTNQLLHLALLNWTADNWLQLGWFPRCITSGRTQEKTPPSTILLLLSWRLPSIRLNIISTETYLRSHCLETSVCLSAYCVATAVLVHFEISAQQRVCTPKCDLINIEIIDIWATIFFYQNLATRNRIEQLHTSVLYEVSGFSKM